MPGKGRTPRKVRTRERLNPDASLVAAPEVGAIAGKEILDHHRRLLDARILFFFTAKKPMRNGRPVIARTTKVPPMGRILSTGGDPEHPRADFTVVVRRDLWQAMDDKQRAAVADHELHHMSFDDEAGHWVIVPHDLEEFAGVVSRHGLYATDVREFAEIAAPQLSLFRQGESDRQAAAARLAEEAAAPPDEDEEEEREPVPAEMHVTSEADEFAMQGARR